MDGVEYGLGLGLSEKLNTARDLWASDQNQRRFQAQAAARQKIAGQKQQDDATNEIMKNFRNDGSYKWHRLLSGEANQAVADAVNKVIALKSSGSPNWQNELFKIQSEFTQKKNELKALNENYLGVEAMSKVYDQGQHFTTQNAMKGIQAFNAATSRQDLANKMQQLGVQNDPFFAFNQDQSIAYKAPAKINILNEIKASIPSSAKLVIGQEMQTLPGGAMHTVDITGLPYTRKDMQELLTNKWNSKLSIPDAVSIEDIAENMLSRPDFYQQYAETRGISMDDTAAVKDRLMKELAVYAIPKVSSKYSSPRVTKVLTGDATQAVYDVISQDGSTVGKFGNKEYEIPTVGHVNFSSDEITPVISRDFSRPDGSVPPAGQGFKMNVSKIFAAPYYTDNGRKIPMNATKDGNIAGYSTFYEFSDGLNIFYVPTDKYSLTLNQLGGSAKEQAAVNDAIKKLKAVAAKKWTEKYGQ